MSDDDKMTINERRKYLRMVRKRYTKAGKIDRGQLLDEMEAVIGLHRKSLIRLMASNLTRCHPSIQAVVIVRSKMSCNGPKQVIFSLAVDR
jgi:hypothetical protein